LRAPIALNVGGLVTFFHRAPLAEDYDQGYPIVEIIRDVPWKPRERYDDGGNLVIPAVSDANLGQLIHQQPVTAATLTLGWDSDVWNCDDNDDLRLPSDSSYLPDPLQTFTDAEDNLPHGDDVLVVWTSVLACLRLDKIWVGISRRPSNYALVVILMDTASWSWYRKDVSLSYQRKTCG
jgi:hypothetical protein